METDETSKPSKGKKRKQNGEDLTVAAPQAINIVEFASSRMEEILAMSERTGTIGSQRGTAQRMPRHMRRRAAGHNVKRLPRNVREKASYYLVKGGAKPVPVKRPSRKHRRRPGNLLQDYVRRQRKHVWLETHLWHAKRFHMCERWGYKLPLHPNSKSYRACYRSSSQHCLLQDVSYMNCIQLEGLEKDLLKGLQQCCRSNEGGSFSSAASRSGSREGTTFLHSVSEPTYPIGPASFLWKPHHSQDNLASDVGDAEMLDAAETGGGAVECSRIIWLWVHPAMHDDVVKQLRIVFSLKDSPNTYIQEADKVPCHVPEKNGEAKDTELSVATAETEKAHTEKKTDDSEAKAVDPRTVATPPEELISDVKYGLKVTLLKHALCRFSLTGPQSNVILADTLMSADVQSAKSCNGTPPRWWQQYYADEKRKDIHSSQSELLSLLKNVSSPAELSPHSVFGMTVRDPRLFLPPKKIWVEQQIEESENVRSDKFPEKLAPAACMSPIWDGNVRTEVKVTRMSDHELNKYRSQNLVPGTPLNLGEKESRIPVLLIQRPGYRPNIKTAKCRHPSCRLGYGSGWDLIIPSGWAMAFWMCLVYRKAHVGAQKESCIIAAESGQLHFPDDFPDTPAGQEWEKTTCKELLDKYNRMPPAKRPNYTKLGVVTPFSFPWKQLIRNWAAQSEQDSLTKTETEPMECNEVDDVVTVLRDGRIVSTLDILCKPVISKTSPEQVCSEHKDSAQVLSSLPSNCLISVFVKMVSRGTPDKFAMICLPLEEDLVKLAADSSYGGPSEARHSDTSKKQHSKYKTSKKRKTNKGSEGSTGVENKPCDMSAVDSIVTGSERARYSSTRQICGFVKHGCFSLSSGQGAGMGFVASAALCDILRLCRSNQQPVVLVRSSSSLQYRFAYLSVNTR